VTEPVTRIRAQVTGEDRYGNPTTTDVESDLPAALFAPEGSPEIAEPGRTIVTQGPSLYWRGEWPDVVSSDRLRVRGEVFAVDGHPADWRGLTGGLVVRLRRVEG